MKLSAVRFLTRIISGIACCFAIAPGVLTAQVVGSCPRSQGEAFLGANNVRARILNTGGLFYRGEPHVYNIPIYSESHSIFAAGIWIGGFINEKLHFAGARYGNNEYWAGPLDDEGNPPDDCNSYDRVFKVTRDDIERYTNTFFTSRDLADWPTGLGAPTMDANGNRIDVLHLPFEQRASRTINLRAHERPIITGDQAIWWVMNDRGNVHNTSDRPPLGVEVHGEAFAARTSAPSVNNATVYRYRIFNRNTAPIQQAYIGIWVDPDLGFFRDDYIGSDSLLDIGFVYNADNKDEEFGGYGTPPPALGIQIIQGPEGKDDGIDNNRDGAIDEPGERSGMSHFMWYNIAPCITCHGNFWGPHMYNLMRGRLPLGDRVTLGGDGQDSANPPINYMFPGDPTIGEFWSEMNLDGLGTRATPGDRRMVISMGPFNLDPGEDTEIVFSIVWAVGDDHLDSVTEMKLAAEEVKEAFFGGFQNLPSGFPPTEYVDRKGPADGEAIQASEPELLWNPSPNAAAYEVELTGPDTTVTHITNQTSWRATYLVAGELYGWRVRAVNSFGFGPWEDRWWFEAGDVLFGTAPFTEFITVANRDGPLIPPDMAAFAFNSSGFPRVPCQAETATLCDRPTRGYQQATNDTAWGIHAGGDRLEYGPLTDSLSFIARITRSGANYPIIGADDYEIRFGPFPGKAIRLFDDQIVVSVPFELWNIGRKTPDDPSDDVRLIPAICEESCGAGAVSGVFDFGGDHAFSGRNDDPLSDWIFWYEPADKSPGIQGYLDFFDGAEGLGPEIFANMVLVQWNGGAEPPYDPALPEAGTVFRIVTGESVAPLLSFPPQNAQVEPGEILFHWDGPDNDFYRLQLSSNADFVAPIWDSTGVVSGQPIVIQPEGEFHWRVESKLYGWAESRSILVTSSPSPSRDISPLVDEELLEIYPNPVTIGTTVKFFQREARETKLEIFDILGRRIGTLIDGERGPGRTLLKYDATGLASGVYLFRYVAGDIIETRKMVVVN